MSGAAVLKEIRTLHEGVPVIIITGYPEWSSAVRALKIGAVDYIQKPIFSDELILERIRQAIETDRRTRQLDGLRADAEQLLQKLGDYHAAHPLRAGMPREELKSRLAQDSAWPLTPRIFNALVSHAAELQLLVVHGVLHLLGHDHNTEAEQASMWKAQASVLRKIGAEIIEPKLDGVT